MLGLICVSTYTWLARCLWLFPENTRHVWAGLRSLDKSGTSLVFIVWCIGEMMSCIGFLVLTAQLWSFDDVDLSVYAFYCSFLIFSAAWAPLTLAKLRHLVLLDLLGVAISAWGLLWTALLLTPHAWWMLPIALHTTLMDLCFWGYTWNPHHATTADNNTIIIGATEKDELMITTSDGTV